MPTTSIHSSGGNAGAPRSMIEHAVRQGRWRGGGRGRPRGRWRASSGGRSAASTTPRWRGGLTAVACADRSASYTRALDGGGLEPRRAGGALREKGGGGGAGSCPHSRSRRTHHAVGLPPAKTPDASTVYRTLSAHHAADVELKVAGAHARHARAVREQRDDDGPRPAPGAVLVPSRGRQAADAPPPQRRPVGADNRLHNGGCAARGGATAAAAAVQEVRLRLRLQGAAAAVAAAADYGVGIPRIPPAGASARRISGKRVESDSAVAR